MSRSDRILLVVSILEGRNFPNQSSCQLTVDAKFDGEILLTDPVEFTSSPDISQELAWELDKKTFQQHKLQRSVIKCNAYSTTSSGTKEHLGYFMIDVRPLSTARKIQWCRLLQTKFPKLKSEFSICAYIEDDQATKTPSSSSMATATTTNATTTTTKPTKQSKSLQPILCQEKNYYQLGADVASAEIFALSITIYSAKNLVHLVSSDANMNTQDGYFFHYNLIGNEITTETFRDLIQPEFRPERASIRLHTTIQLLRTYLQTFHPIDFTLWSGNEILGQTQIPIHKILQQQKSNFDVLVEDFHLRLSPSKRNEKSSSIDDDHLQPTVRIELKLARETPPAPAPVESKSNITPRIRLASAVDQIPPANIPLNDSQLSHHYCLSIDLKSLRNLRLSHSTYLYCRYVYPFLGTSTPILTNPPLHIPYTSSAPPNEHLLPHGLCIFNFAVHTDQLANHFHREPLVIEVYSRDQERSERKDQLFGLVQFSLENVLQVEKQRCSSNVNGILGWRQTFTQVLPVVGTNTEKCAELLVTIVLEDLGALHLNSLPTPRAQSVPPQSFGLDQVFQRPSEDTQLQAAYELQLWKESKELEFEKHLREVEAKKLYELMEAFKEKDRERESLLQKKMKEYGELEKQMKKALTDLEKREKQLSTKEQEIQRMQIDLKRDYDNKYIEIREASKRLQEQSEHQITLEKSKNQALDDEIIRLKRSATEWEKRYRDKEQEYFSFKEKQRQTPEVKLQADMNLLTLEKKELERKLEASLSAVARYKQLNAKIMKECKLLKQRESDQLKLSVQKQQQELEHMRLRYLAAEENQIMKNDHKQLESIKNQLSCLREVSTTPTILTTGHDGNGGDDDDDDYLHSNENEQIDQQLGVLIEHRDSLLQTGAYTHKDALIQELERRIEEATKRKSRH